MATTASSDHALMRAALREAARGPVVDANPRVGCVIADPAGTVVGTGFHAGAGTAHAEVVALTQAGESARGATAFVTLEPCNHYGRTPPCTEALLAAGISRVRYAVADPSASAAGGAKRLSEAGLDVRLVEVDGAQELNRSWLHAARTGMPWVTFKCAMSLDGRVAAADGSSRWITGAAARAQVHQLRAEVGAIVVGSGTVAADDPALTVRDADGVEIGAQPLPVVIGSELPPSSRLAANPRTVHLTDHDPVLALKGLQQRGIHHVLLEGGPRLAAGWLRAGVVSEILAYLAPVLIGSGASVLGDLGVATLADAQRWQTTEVSQVGQDVRIVLTPPTSAPTTVQSAQEA
ncbi:bifunctional diaminohydroxyphosphoribosylaminopyrimidine deaminase/5-amino-6-(5-phosphoribosylamino)uracil reductase RibD [Dermacoccaceae bacterium W4C1]